MASWFKGPWDKLVNTFNSGRDWLMGPAQDEMLVFGWAIQDQIKDAMRTNRYQLASATIFRKMAMGRSQPSQAWLDTLALLEGGLDTPRVEAKGLGRKSLLALVSEDGHPTAGMSYAELFSTLEYGTNKAPPRPILKPIADSVNSGKNPALEVFKASMANKIRLRIS